MSSKRAKIINMPKMAYSHDQHGLSWIVMDCHGLLSLIVLDCHGLSCTVVMDCLELSWTVMDYPRLNLALYREARL